MRTLLRRHSTTDSDDTREHERTDPADETAADVVEESEKGRGKKTRKKSRAGSPRVSLDAAIGGQITVHRMAGQPRTRPATGKTSILRGWNPTGTLTTSRAAGALTLATAGAPTGYDGILFGIDVLTNQPVIHDPFTAYNDKTQPGFTSPNVLFVGDVGAAKSSGAKTWAVVRALLLGYRVIVVDKKLQDNAIDRRGEYAPLARDLGTVPITLRPGDATSTKLNLLDPQIAGQGEAGGVGQQQLLEAVASLALGGPVSPEQATALRVARHSAVAAARSENRVATIIDVLRYLARPDQDMIADEPFVTDAEELRGWGQMVGLALDNLVQDELSGIIDGPTSPDVKLNSSLTVFDVSGLDEESAAIPVVMGLINTWMRALISSESRSVPTIFLIEEGWHLAAGAFAKVSRRNAKVARGIALENVTALQHLSDIDADSPAQAMIREAQTVFAYSQAKTDDARACVDLLGWDDQAVEFIRSLPQGTALVQIGQDPPIMVRHVRSGWEETITNTDAAMASTNRQALDEARAATAPAPVLEKGES